MSYWKKKFDLEGVVLIDRLINDDEVKNLNELLQPYSPTSLKGGIRNIDKKIPLIENFCQSKRLLDYTKKFIGYDTRLLRAIYFNKSVTNNWLVSWHQDKSIIVDEKFERAGWGPWSLKEGILHVQPPVKVLDQMVTIRLHLDDCDEENGCLKVIKSSHSLGLLKSDQITDIVGKSEHTSCVVNAGGLVVIKPHILHASSKSVRPSNRRVLHLEYIVDKPVNDFF